MNGVYLQLHAYMLRIAIPYGTLSSDQMRKLAHVARRYDRGYGHFTTRQNIQFHWIKLAELPDAMADLAERRLHGMQTSGNCVRNITTDQWAGVAPDEIEDPRIWAELMRQHLDPASGILVPAAQVQDRGQRGRSTTAPRWRSTIFGAAAPSQWRRRDRLRNRGRRRTRPHAVPRQDHQAVPAKRDLLSYVEAVLRLYNQYGRRDNIYKARIKILVHDLGAERSARKSRRSGRRSRTARWRSIRRSSPTSRRAFAIRIMSGSRTTRRRWRQARKSDRALRHLARQFRAEPQGARLRHRHALA